MLPIRDFEKRFRALLEEMDELRESNDIDAAIDMDELCADFEDTLFVLECTEPDDEDAEEAFGDALDEIGDIADTLEDASDEALTDIARRLKSLAAFAANQLS